MFVGSGLVCGRLVLVVVEEEGGNVEVRKRGRRGSKRGGEKEDRRG